MPEKSSHLSSGGDIVGGCDIAAAGDFNGGGDIGSGSDDIGGGSGDSGSESSGGGRATMDSSGMPRYTLVDLGPALNKTILMVIKSHR